jgi:bifunctional DNA-binding transcriptional regulator/antitoxin component of YhaV-PrlF toxin-antitoxin module
MPRRITTVSSKRQFVIPAEIRASLGIEPGTRTYALDANAVLRYLDGEAGSDRVAEIIKSHLVGGCKAVISAVHWG